MKGDLGGCYKRAFNLDKGQYAYACTQSHPAYDPSLRAKARALRKNGTLGEVLLWKALQRKALGVEFHRQVPIGQYIIDFFCHELMLAIEIDGMTHRNPEAFARDTPRQRDLEEMGVRFLRFQEQKVRRDIRNVMDAIMSWIQEHEE